MMRVLGLAVLVSVLVVAACSSGGSDRAETVSPVAPTPTEAATADEAEGVSQPESTPTPAGEAVEITAEELSAALLTLDDMPTGWTISPPDEDDDDDGTELCGQEFGEVAEAVDRAEASFNQSDLGPFIVQTLGLFREGEAGQNLALFVEAAGSCSEWTAVDSEGEETNWRISALSFPKFGDETFAFRLSSDPTIIGIVTVDAIIVRRGDVILLLAHLAFGFEGVDSELTESLTRIADEKLENIR